MTGVNWSMVSPYDIPSGLILKHPIVEELTSSLELNLGNGVKIPYIIKNAKLMSEGTWNSIYYSSDVLEDAYKKTDWEDKSVTALYEDHADNNTGAWIGEVKNVKYQDGALYGDLHIYDLSMALKLALGKPKFGISPKLEGTTDMGRKNMKECVFRNFSLVVNPACKETYLNSALDKVYIEQEVDNLTEEKAAVELKKEEDKPEKYPDQKKEEEEPEDKAKEKLSEYTSFIKDYIKKHPDADLAEAAAAWKEKKKLSELNDADIITKLYDLLELLKKKKYPEPEKIEEMSKSIQVMSEKIEKIEGKLNEPERLTVVKSIPSNVDSDIVMLQYLKEVSK